ncbi:MAG TPA: RlpA-like double-psi beta-barrel domain-containing protein [Actinomycetota bacterium]|nr:RlpA-like double-psi beta-barrel domain-containing protein [Actinomycetota bacterium]
MGGTVGANERAPNQASGTSADPPAAAQAAVGGPGVTPTDASPVAPGVTPTDAAPVAPGVTLTGTPPAPPPSPDGTVTTGPSVSATVMILHDGTSTKTSSTAPTVGALLQQMGLRVSTLDRVTPPLIAALPGVAVVRIVRVTQATERQNIDVPFRTTIKQSDKVELGVESTAQTGANGLTQKVFRKTFQDGKLVSTVLASTQVVRPARDEIKLIGTHQPSCACQGGSASGKATWYSIGGLTSASTTLPFGTVVKVTNTDNGRSVDVVIRDRGPYADPDRIIDLSPTAFAQIGGLGTGVIPVQIEW